MSVRAPLSPYQLNRKMGPPNRAARALSNQHLERR
jgi:hypothetical protein